ncbi:hypothetical protein LTR37_014262 [Vermiconidia calcicola]|uniref:Uncharacterized protein n=1 Tax=Vermiconidia calcicola TaxID=1690605 RepID=A0ACC3MUR4_9PEZI|nr:hypothetical protein LTR37_014262 [Vermiconidia calcicola]
MSLGYTLSQSIAALERIASLDPEYTRGTSDSEDSLASSAPVYRDIERPRYRGAYHPSAYQDEEKLTHAGTSQPLSQSADSEKAHSSRRYKMEIHEDADDAQPKLKFARVLETTANFLGLVLSFLNPAIAVCIIGLAADNINWATGRGSQESNIVDAVVDVLYNETSDRWEKYKTRMPYLPSYYDTETFSALIGVASVCTLGGLLVAPLSIVRWKALGRSVKLSRKTNTSQSKILLACVVLDIFMFAVALIVIIYARELFRTLGNEYDHEIQLKWFDPPLLMAGQSDDVIRYYHSPAHYNPISWNCRFRGHVSSRMQRRVFEMCNEGIAARTLFALLVALQGLMLVSHTWAWQTERKGGKFPWARSVSRSEERILPLDARSD